MSMRRVFLESFSVGMRQWRVAAVVFGFQFLLALTVGMQFLGVFEASIGSSLEAEKLLKNYDHTVVTDFLKVHGASITPLLGQLRWLVLVYLVFAVFLDAGLLACASELEKRADWRRFWAAGAEWFWPFFKIALIFLSLAGLWSAAIWLPVLMNLQSSLEHFPTEAYAVWGIFWAAAIWLFGLAVLFAWSVFSRLEKMKTGASVLASVGAGAKHFWRKKGRALGLLGLFGSLQIVLFGLYFLLDGWAGMTSAGWIVAFFLVQQALVFFRIQIRQMVYGGLARV